MGFIALALIAISFYVAPDKTPFPALVGAGAFTIIIWLVACIKRYTTLCPMCKGTPLINSGARPHAKARRFIPFNHGTSAVLSIMFTHKFRCMYCGMDFDLLKPRKRHLTESRRD